MGHDHSHAHGSHGHGHGHDHGGLNAHGSGDKRRVLAAAGLTLGFMIVEVVGGLLTGSLALLADAGHMLTDSVSLVLAWYAFHLASRPATGRLTYGFDRMKTLVAYTNGLGIFVIGAWIVYEAAHRLAEPAPVLGGPMLAVALAGLLVNVVAFLVLSGGDRASLNMRGAILHVLGDLLGSAAAIAAGLVILATGWTPIDPILSVVVALLLFSTAWSLVKDSGHLLLEGAPRDIDRDAIQDDLARHVAGVRGIHHMHVWSLDGSRNVATLHALLEEGADAHAAVVSLKRRLADRHGIGHATVETERDACTDTALKEAPGAHIH